MCYNDTDEISFDGNLLLLEQADVEDASSYEVVEGSITISSQVTDLSPLSSLTRIEDNLTIVATTNLETLHGLHNLKSVKKILRSFKMTRY